MAVFAFHTEAFSELIIQGIHGELISLISEKFTGNSTEIFKRKSVQNFSVINTFAYCVYMYSMRLRVFKTYHTVHIRHASDSHNQAQYIYTESANETRKVLCTRKILSFYCPVRAPGAVHGFVRIGPIRFLAGCRTRRLNQG